ncbi:hypothetical protein V1291_003611 [Nitrobacteraceae bacterium AZCC 1564]
MVPPWLITVSPSPITWRSVILLILLLSVAVIDPSGRLHTDDQLADSFRSMLFLVSGRYWLKFGHVI